MAYQLGVDLGTTFTAAAIFRDGHVEVVALETHGVTVPTVVFAADQQLVFGNAAVQRGRTDPTGLAREFKRRVGDDVAVVFGGVMHSAVELMALFADWVVDRVADQMGERPSRIALTHPANWTARQRDLLRQALATTKLGEVDLLAEPEAAALDYASTKEVETGQLILVYDLGGGTFDITLLRRDRDGFTPVGDASGIADLGGIDFDELILQRVLDHVPDDVITQARQQQHPGLYELRRAVTEAKEGLSNAVSVQIPVLLPGYSGTVRLIRHEFEEEIRGDLLRTVATIRTTLTSANVDISDVSAALLVGGSSRMPCVSDLLMSELGVATKVDVHAKLVVVRGAARWAATSTATKATARKRPSSRRDPREASGEERRRRFRDALNSLSSRSAGVGLRLSDLIKFGMVMAVVAGAIVAIAYVLVIRDRPTTTVVSDAPSPIALHVAAPRTADFLDRSAATYAQFFAVGATNDQRRQACQAHLATLAPLSGRDGEPVPGSLADELATLTQQDVAAPALERLVIRWTQFWSSCAQEDLTDDDLHGLFNAIEAASGDCVRVGACAAPPDPISTTTTS